jgi:hypothetical protein
MAAPSRRRRSPQAAKKAIDGLDLEKIDAKAMKLYRWRRPRARAADKWYRNFLWLCYKHGTPVAAIGKDADDLWHLHILDTRKYAADCQRIFGSYLDHHPLYGRPTAEDRDMFEDTKELYMMEFAQLPPHPTTVSWH